MFIIMTLKALVMTSDRNSHNDGREVVSTFAPQPFITVGE